jgi:hypothetical protein
MEAELGEELVGLDVARGFCFGFNDVATHVWRLLERPLTVGELCDALQEAYHVAPEQCRNEVCELVENMTAEGLVVAASGRESDRNEAC